MASGYVIAALLETAGLIGLVIAAVKIRAERQAKAGELRSFLRSGQLPPSIPVLVRSRWTSATGGRTLTLQATSGRTPAAGESTARSALGRAIVRSGRAVRDDLGGPVSAG